MTDVNETRALKASFRGTFDTASELSKLQGRIEALDDHVEIDNALLEDLGRLSVAHAVASAALRGLVIRMQTRRGAATSA